ncbi:MAG: FHA domain-containing protein [Myxococcota bacterium]
MDVRLIHPAIGELRLTLLADVPFLLGRAGGDVDLEMNWDPRVSRRHGRLVLSGHRVFFEDLSSRNGSWYGDTRLTGSVLLDPGMTITLGETVLQLDAPADRRTFHGLGAALPSEPELRRRNSSAPAGGISTADLRTEEPPPALPRIRRLKTSPHFATPDRLEVSVEGPEEMGELLDGELGNGVLFIPTRNFLPVGHAVNVRITAPTGAVDLRAVVKHVVGVAEAALTQRTSGVGLVFTDLGTTEKSALMAYARRQSYSLQPEQQPIDLPTELTIAVRDFLAAVDKNDLYGAISLPAEAPDHDVRRRLDDFAGWLASESTHASAADGLRIDAARSALSKIEETLCDPLRRLAHDFKTGNVRAEERISIAKCRIGPSLAQLRRAWELAWPEQADRAALMTRKAFTLRQRGDLPQAIEIARSALGLHPFFDELRPSLKAWEELYAESRPRGPRPAKS